MLPPRLYSASATATATAIPYFSKPLLTSLRRPPSTPAAAALRTQRSTSAATCLSTASPPSSTAFAARPPPSLSRRTLSSFARAKHVCLGQASETSQLPAMTIPTRSSSTDDHDAYVICSLFNVEVRVKPASCFPPRVLADLPPAEAGGSRTAPRHKSRCFLPSSSFLSFKHRARVSSFPILLPILLSILLSHTTLHSITAQMAPDCGVPEIVLTEVPSNSVSSFDFSHMKFQIDGSSSSSPHPTTIDFDTSFDEAARKALHIQGLVPPAVEGFSKQERRCKLHRPYLVSSLVPVVVHRTPSRALFPQRWWMSQSIARLGRVNPLGGAGCV